MNILEKIMASTRIRVEREKQECSLEMLKRAGDKVSPAFCFEKALSVPGLSFICEVKKASPSKGLISPDFPYLDIARDYEAAGAAAVSVLTEPDYFQGNNRYLTEIKKEISIPVLRKDFIIDEYQIYQSAAIGANAILLICAILEQDKLQAFIELADSLGLSCLVEAHDEADMEMAIKAGARIIGVNNRDLRTFQVDVGNSIRLRKLVPSDILFVSESGISGRKETALLEEHGADAVLVGEALMRSSDKKAALSKIIRPV